MQALQAKIEAMELYILTMLFPKFKLDNVAYTNELNEYLGKVNGKCGGKLGQLYDERDLALWQDRLLQQPTASSVIGTAHIKFTGTEHKSNRHSRTCKGKKYKNKPRDQHSAKPVQAEKSKKDQQGKKRGHQKAA